MERDRYLKPMAEVIAIDAGAVLQETSVTFTGREADRQSIMNGHPTTSANNYTNDYGDSDE